MSTAMRASERPARGRSQQVEESGRRTWLTPLGRRYFLLVYGLVVLGLVLVFSASYPFAGRPTLHGNDPLHYFRLQLGYALLGLVLMLGVAKVRPRALIAWSWVPGAALGFGWALMVAAILYGHITGRYVNGSCAWLPWPVPWEPSEFAKLAFIVFVASRLAAGGPPRRREQSGPIWIPIMGATVGTSVLLMLQQELGTALVIILVTLGMALIGGMRLRTWVPLTAVVGLLSLGVARAVPHAWHRFAVWLHPEKYLQGAGLHVYNMLITLAHGGVVGQGLGVSPEKWGALSERFTDSIFCVIGGELGLGGGVGIIALMVLLAVCAFQIARRCPHRLGFFIASGVGLSFAVQGFINIAVATASMPPTGMTLPFISYGGSSILSCLLGAGLVLAMAADEPARGDV
jgi:cell division protein FtsW